MTSIDERTHQIEEGSSRATHIARRSVGGCSFLGAALGLAVDMMNNSATVLGPGRPSSVTSPA